jgi:hypothetical protein
VFDYKKFFLKGL